MTTAVSDLQSAGHSHERRRLAALLSGGGPQPLADPVLDQLLDPLPDDFAHLRQVILGEIEFGKNLLAYLVLQLLSVSVVCPAFQAFLQNLVDQALGGSSLIAGPQQIGRASCRARVCKYV